MPSSEPSADASEEPGPGSRSTGWPLPFLGRTPKTEPSDEIEPEVVLEGGVQDLAQMTADRLMHTDAGTVLEGNVMIVFDRTSITATRAVAKGAADGSVTLTLEDAVLTTGPVTPAPTTSPRRTESSR